MNRLGPTNGRRHRLIPVVDFEAAQDAEPIATGLEPRAALTGARSGGRHRQTRSKGART